MADELIPFGADGAIASIESGGRYDILGPLITSGSMAGQRALGKYQVMESNVGPWTERYLGRRLSPQEFLRSPEAQETVFRGEFGRLAQKYGPEGAARAWFAGEGGMNDPNRRDMLGTTVAAYAKKFNAAMPQMVANAAMPQMAFASNDGMREIQASMKPEISFDHLIPKSGAKQELSFDHLIPQAATVPPVEPAAPSNFGQRLVSDFQNIITGAKQRTSPHVGDYKLVSAEVFMDDAGNAQYRDPQTGQLVLADRSKHVVLEDPADRTIKVYEKSAETDESALGGMSRVAMAGMGAGAPSRLAGGAAALTPKPGEVVTAAADRLGVSIPKAVASDTVGVQHIAGSLANIPLVGTPLRKASGAAIQGLDEAAAAAQAGYGSGSIPAAGAAARKGIETAIRSGPIKERVTELYNRVDGFVNPVTTASLPNTRLTAGNIVARRMNAALPESGVVGELQQALARPGMNYEGVKDLRTFFGEMLDGSQVIPEGMSMGEVKQIYGALSKDLRIVIAKAGGQEGLAAYDKAEKAASRWAGIREDLQRVLNANSEEAVFDKIAAAAGSTSRADLSLLGRVRGAVGSENWDDIASAVISRMGRPDARTNVFSPDHFLTAYNKLSKEGKQLLFRSTNNASHAAALDDIAIVSERFKSLNRFANPSGTGQTAATAAGGWGFYADPYTAVYTAVTGRVLSHLLARPKTARDMSEWSKAYLALAENPSAARLSNFNQATNVFATSVGREVGRPDLVPDLLRKLQGTVPAAATDDPQQGVIGQ